ncbi:ribosomal protein L7Ae/L30e/S12e/Gadd45 [Tanacetum coccineum]
MAKAKENVLNVGIQITSSENVQNYQEATIKEPLLEDHGVIATKMKKKRLKTKNVLWLKLLMRIKSARATPKAHLPYGMFLTRLFRHVMELYPHLDNGIYDVVERVMHPLALRQTRRPRSDRGKACYSVSSTSAHHNRGSSSHQGDDDEDNGASRASTPSPTTYLNSLGTLDYQQYDVPTSSEKMMIFYSNVKPTCSIKHNKCIRNLKDVGKDDDFNNGAWVRATNYMNAFGGTVPGCLRDIDNFLKKGKLEQVVAIVKSCSSNMLSDLNVTLKDLSGIAMILANVSVFNPKPSHLYLNITKRNVIEIKGKDPLHLRSSAGDRNGTHYCGEKDAYVEKVVVELYAPNVAGDGVASIKRRRRDLYSDDIKNFVTASGHGRLKEDLESSTRRRHQDF